MPNPVQQEDIASLIGETELRDVRLVGIHADVEQTPAEVRVQFKAGGVSVNQDETEIVVRFEHETEFCTIDGDPVATINLAHVARFTYADGLKLNDDSVGHWVFGNVYFMVYPYVRQALQDACLRLGLPSVVLGYLKRGEIAPEAVTMVVDSTIFERPATTGEPLPFEASRSDSPPADSPGSKQ